jgi:hypothetical protein
MGEDVSIRMTEKALLKGDGDASEDKLPSLYQSVNIISHPLFATFVKR